MKKTKIRDEQKGWIFIAIIILIIVALVFFFAKSLKHNVVQDELKESDIVRMLFVVQDSDESILFSNVMILDHKTNKGALVNLPGFTGSIYKSLGRTDRLDVIYSEKGIESFKTEIERLLSIQIPFYSVISLDGFLQMSDYLGGMRVFIPEPVDYVDDDGQRWLLPSGSVNLDGDKLNIYLHYRMAEESEFDIQERYQNVMTAFISGLHEKKFTIFSKDNFKFYGKNIETNVKDKEEKILYQTVAEVDSESLIKQTISGSLRNVDGQVLLMPDNNGDLIKEALKQTTSMLISTDGTVSSRVYVLEIQNGTTTNGLARNTSALFQKANYDVLSTLNADRNDYEKTIIIDHYGNEETARMVGEFIHCTNIIRPETPEEIELYATDTSVDFTIILGKDFNGRYVTGGR